MVHGPKHFSWLVLGLFLVASPLSGQTVQGRVVEAGVGRAVAGANVLLLDSAGRMVGSGLTDGRGAFRIRASAAGHYRVRAEMIGRESRVSGLIDITAGEPVSLVLELPVEAIRLDAIDVAASKVCRSMPAAGIDTHAIWEEARKALSSRETVLATRMYWFDIVRFERVLDPIDRSVLEERNTAQMRTSSDPFWSASPEELAADGYYRALDGGRYYLHGPGPAVLLSEPFLDTHCFAPVRDAAHPGAIGLMFRPLQGRGVTDIEGVFWLDEVTAVLQTLEFTYANLPPYSPPGPHGGRATFERLANGAVIVKSWEIWTPVGQRAELPRGVAGKWRVVVDQAARLNSEGGMVAGVVDRVSRERPGLDSSRANPNVTEPAPPATPDEMRLEEDVASARDWLASKGWHQRYGQPGGLLKLDRSEAALVGATAISDILRRVDGIRIRRLVNEGTEIYLPTAVPAGECPVSVFLNGSALVLGELAWNALPGRTTGKRGLDLDDLLKPSALDGLELYGSADNPVAADDECGSLLLWSWSARSAVDEPFVGSVRGRVIEETTNEAVAGAVVYLEGEDRRVLSDSDGQFEFTALLPGQYELVVSYGDATYRDSIAAKAFGILSIDVHVSETPRVAQPVAGVRAKGTARVFGLVVDREDGGAVASVRVILTPGDLRTETSGAGRFIIEDVAAGSYTVRLERLGYETRTDTVVLEEGQDVDVVMQLATSPIALEPIEIVVRTPSLMEAGFYDRRMLGGGTATFLTAEDIERIEPTTLSDVVRRVQSTRIVDLGPGQKVVRFNRQQGLKLGGLPGCEPAVFLDGTRIQDQMLGEPRLSDFNRVVDPYSVAGIEIYVGAGTPLRYKHTDCGAVVIWTKRGG